MPSSFFPRRKEMFRIKRCRIQMTGLVLFLVVPLTMASKGAAHDGPDPIAHWRFDQTSIRDNALIARLGPDVSFENKPRLHKDVMGQSVIFTGNVMEGVVAKDFRSLAIMPEQDMTISAWVAIEKPLDWGGIIGSIQDNGNAEAGWLLGYRNNRFTFGLSSVGADDGDGMMTYVDSETEFEPGRMYHVVAVYDGSVMQLYVNGKLESSSEIQSGKLLYPDSAPFVIGCYHDANEFNPMQGRIREIKLFDLAAKQKWVSGEFEHNRKLAALPGFVRDASKEFVVKPYLQYGTLDGMTVCWRSAKKCTGKLLWGEDARCENVIESTEESEISSLRITGLQPETQYFYRVQTLNADGDEIFSDVATFQTAAKPETPFAFAVIGDTQGNPSVAGSIAELAWEQRPNFMVHAGDLVDQGKMGDDWIDEFFSSMHPLISRVPMYPVLGNHEQNAQNYFDYMALPDPEYYYQFSYGNSDFFMIDTNRKVDPESEQFQWLDKALGESKATWKFVCHHHPPYSSDENDYGDLWKTNKSTRGDTRVRALVPLYDKHGVDIVWNGHIHSYERTWPLSKNRAVDEGGTIYMITGGGGGGLETPGPYRPYFQNNVRRGHHYTMVAINGNQLELKSFSIDNKLFDTVKIEKK